MEDYSSLLPHSRIELVLRDKTVLRGNFFAGRDPNVVAATIIFIHGIGLVKEQYLENWIGPLLDAGYHAVSYDHRSFGESDGIPRETFHWRDQAEDLIDVVTRVQRFPTVNSRAVYVWGVAHSASVAAMAAAISDSIAGIMMFLPCIDGTYDKRIWGKWLEKKIASHRHDPDSSQTTDIQFWPLGPANSNDSDQCVLSGDYVQRWSILGKKMAEQQGNTFTGRLTLTSFWNDCNCRPMDVFDLITPTPILWIMATDDIVCGPLEFTKAVYDKLAGPKQLCVLEGEHLPQYFNPGLTQSLEAMLSFLSSYAPKPTN